MLAQAALELDADRARADDDRALAADAGDAGAAAHLRDDQAGDDDEHRAEDAGDGERLDLGVADVGQRAGPSAPVAAISTAVPTWRAVSSADIRAGRAPYMPCEARRAMAPKPNSRASSRPV
jgi:hypothetical protein